MAGHLRLRLQLLLRGRHQLRRRELGLRPRGMQLLLPPTLLGGRRGRGDRRGLLDALRFGGRRGLLRLLLGQLVLQELQSPLHLFGACGRRLQLRGCPLARRRQLPLEVGVREPQVS